MCFRRRSARRATGSPESSIRAGAIGTNSGLVACGGGCMAIGRRSAEAALQSNLPSAEFLASRNSGFERGALSEIAFDAQAMALQLGPGERLEAVEVPVLGGVSRVLEQAIVGHGVNGPASQDFQH